MPTDLPIKCSCGSFRGVARQISGRAGIRLICYCDDCQSFAQFLGRADEILDTHGGTDIFQTSPAKIEITEGRDHLACMRLTPNGLLRWYADCCKTPVGCTQPTRQVPFVGLIHACMNSEDQSLDEFIGPVSARIQGKYANGDRNEIKAHDKTPASVIFRLLPRLLVWRLRGDHNLTPFFDEDGAPVVAPRILDEQNSS